MSFHVISASAGSGKTYSLSLEVLKIILMPQTGLRPVRFVLAVTFTNKAAAEMKERLIENLQMLSEGKAEKNLIDELIRFLNVSENELQKTAAKRLEEILFHYDDLSYSTIDTFTFGLIKSFARELGITPGVTVEMNDNETVDLLIENYLNKLTNDTPLLDELKKISIQRIEEDKNWDVFPEISKLKNYILPDKFHLFTKELMKLKAEIIKQEKKRLFKKQKTAREEAKKLLNELKTFLSDPAIEKKIKYAKNLQTQIEKFIQGENVNGKAFENFLSGELSYFLKKNQILLPDEKNKWFTISGKLQKQLRQHRIASYFLAAMQPLSLMQTIVEEIERYKEENDTIFISDFNKIIHRVIKNNPAPFIYYRTGEKFDFHFIDEFQDTSQIQWENIQPLIAEILSKESIIKNQPGKSFIYGDAKQSIYRFRGGYPEQFIKLYATGFTPFSHAEKKTNRLENNWRSAPEIVEFNNRFFSEITKYSGIQKDLYEKVYLPENIRQTPQKTFQGYVEINLQTTDTEEEYLQQISNLVKKLVEEKNYNPGDICILFNKNKEGEQIAAALTKENFHVLSENSLTLSNSLKINMLIDFFRYHLTQDTAALLKALFAFQKIAGIKFNLQDYAKFSNKDLNQIIETINGKNPEINKGASLFDFFTKLISALNLNTGSEKSYLKVFLSEINKLTSHYLSPADFPGYWDKILHKVTLESAPHDQAVRLMTVHKAKGLEFPVVIYAYANQDIKPKYDNLIWIPTQKFTRIPFLPLRFNEVKYLYEAFGLYEKEYQDFLEAHLFDLINKIYVAFTRPKEKLYVLANNKIRSKDSNSQTVFKSKIQSLSFLTQKVENIYTYVEETEALDKKETSPSTKETSLHITHTPYDNPVIHFDMKKMELWEEEHRKPVETGLIIHHYLSQIICKEDWPFIRRKIEKENKENQAQEIIEAIENLIQNPKTVFLFDCQQKILTERSILSGTIYRPDRLIFTGTNNIIIVDFKTGMPRPDHQKQISDYARVLEKSGLDVIKKILLYKEENNWKRIEV